MLHSIKKKKEAAVIGMSTLGWVLWGQRAGPVSSLKARSLHFSVPQFTICKMTELGERDSKGFSSSEILWLNKTRPSWHKIFEWPLFLGVRLAFFFATQFFNKDLALRWLKLSSESKIIKLSQLLQLLWKGGYWKEESGIWEAVRSDSCLSRVCLNGSYPITYHELKKRNLWREQVRCSEKMGKGCLCPHFLASLFLLTSRLWPFFRAETPLKNLVTLIQLVQSLEHWNTGF